jgi:hypothetical protein
MSTVQLDYAQPTRPTATPSHARAMLIALLAAFGTYFCVYGFRKPMTAGSYSDYTLSNLGFKEILVTAQVLGYMLSKFIGIKVIAEMPPHRRAIAMVVLVALAEAALVLFAVLPRPWCAVGLFLNGLPLGMTFGLVLGFLEGRRETEALTAGLCTSFILADGVTKSVGAMLLGYGVSEQWMPAAAGAVFAIPFLVCVAMLARVPPPTADDEAARTVRLPMDRQQRRALFRRFAPGLVLLVLMYLIVTILRSIRADFAPQLWKGLGLTVPPSTYTTSEFWVALGVLAVNGSASFIRDNRRAFFISLATCLAGFVLLGVAMTGLTFGFFAPFPFMVLVGLGLYLPYVAIHTTVFERLIAMTRQVGNLGFLLYVADAFGYLGYVGVMLGRNIAGAGQNMLPFFILTCWATFAVSVVAVLAAWWYFAKSTSRHDPAPPAAVAA